MKLNAYLFSLLNYNDQQQYIMEHAVFITERSDELFRYLLHNINGMYIEEVRFLRNNAGLSFMCTDDFNTLAKYTESVVIPY